MRPTRPLRDLALAGALRFNPQLADLGKGGRNALLARRSPTGPTFVTPGKAVQAEPNGFG